MAFGGGVRLCVGADFAKLQLAIYLHYLVTKCRSILLFLFTKASWTEQNTLSEVNFYFPIHNNRSQLFRWKVTKGGEIIRKPGLMFPNGLHMDISERQN